MPTPGREREILAAGAVVLGPGRNSVLLVHRPKYDDWSFPKGKLGGREHVTAAAVREVFEETGVRIRLGVPLPQQRYEIRAGTKVVRYWLGRALDHADVSSYQPNSEIDKVCWFPISKARRRLSYPFDLETLEAALEQPRKTRTVIVLRHGEATPRKAWHGPDPKRPLRGAGEKQAAALVPVLAAYDVREAVSSPSTRCLQTVEPYLSATGCGLRAEPLLSEEGATPNDVRRVTEELLAHLERRPASAGALVICSHRPVLPAIFAATGVVDPALAPGEMTVLHLRRGRLAASERHLVR